MATTDRVLQRAHSFLARHRGEPAVGDTFGYFTEHPLAALNQRRLGAILDVLVARREELGRPLRVLDLACGGGLISCAVAETGNTVLGLDSSAIEIELAQAFAREQEFAASFRQVDLIDDPDWESVVRQELGAAPDVVVLAYALHHLPRVESFAERLGRFLEPGALLIVNEENPWSPLFALKHQYRTWVKRNTDIEWHRSYAAWRALLEASGFDVAVPSGLDPVPALGRFAPRLCWSLVFQATRSP
jgi:2-polyprenyl-3-methyl-5-hydroxy-6-metoxy-1,4-benzoquinol methylase